MSAFDDFVAVAEQDARIVGVILGGSRGKGFATVHSDWDVYVVVDDAAAPGDVTDSFAVIPRDVQMCAVLTLRGFACHAAVGERGEWDRYNFAHLTATLDRTRGELQRLCDAKERLPSEVAESRATSSLDAYVNSYFRSLKNARDGNEEASRLDAAESVNHLLNFVFTAEGRVRPYNKYLAWELETHPLHGHWFSQDPPIEIVQRVAQGRLAEATEQFRVVETAARVSGFSDLLDSWGERDLRMMRQGIE